MPAHPSVIVLMMYSEVEASVARCLRTPPDAAKRQGLKIGLSSCVTQPEQPEQSCRWQLLLWPDNGGTMPSKSTPFTPSSILFRPRRSSRILELWWRRRVLPPGPIGLLRRPFIAIAGLRRHPEYKAQWLTKKEAHRGISGRIPAGQGRPAWRPGPAWAARSPAAAMPESLLA